MLDRSGEDRLAPYRPPIPRRVWRDAVGARIADRSEPVLLERGTLAVKVATSVWAHELSLLAPSIVARLRARNVAVDELRFRVGAIDPSPRPPERRISRAVPPPAALPADLARLLKTVPDLELRETIALAARANLAWQDHLRKSDVSEGSPAAPAPRAAGKGSDPPGRTSAASL